MSDEKRGQAALFDALTKPPIWVVDVVGLLTHDRTDLSDAQRAFAQPAQRVADWELSGPAQLADVVHKVDVGVLLGLSTAAGAFTEPVVREMVGKTERPIIFPLSNSTSRAEAHPAELDACTDGRALIATARLSRRSAVAVWNALWRSATTSTSFRQWGWP